MRIIDVSTWSRSEHFRAYNASWEPHFSITANLDLTRFYPAAKHSGSTLTVAIVYAISRAANTVPELRYRIRGEMVVEHAVVHPSITVMADGDAFTFCALDYGPDFPGFATQAAERIAYSRQHPSLKDEPGRDDFLFMTSIPWVSFTAFSHPGHMGAATSIPMMAWGKLFSDGGRQMMPLCIKVHHAVVDGVHVGRFYEKLQAILDQPAWMAGSD
jgi:chloramphenicol O-acetyltransferase type A